jgi:hypothetical protein
MNFEEVKHEISKIEGGFDPFSLTFAYVPFPIYMSLYVASFAIEMANNTINNYLRKDSALNEEKITTRTELFIQVIRRTIDNFIPPVLIFHYSEFILQTSLLVSHFISGYQVVGQRLIRRIFSPAYLATKGIKNVVAFYSALSSGYDKAKKTADSIAQKFKKQPKAVQEIRADIQKDKESSAAIKESAKKVYEEIVKSSESPKTK